MKMLLVPLKYYIMATFLTILTVKCTIDLNLAEIQFLSDHLTLMECRKIVAAAHYKNYEQPNSLEDAERKLPKDQTCIQLLLHWNSQKGEGKGETHELLEHRLRQIGKEKLADWLGKTVFKQLGRDLERSLDEGFKDTANETITEEKFFAGPTLQAEIENEDPMKWQPIDSVLYAIAGVLLVAIVVLCCRLLYIFTCRDKKWKTKKQPHYEIMEQDTSGSDSEDKFDVRDHTNDQRKVFNRK